MDQHADRLTEAVNTKFEVLVWWNRSRVYSLSRRRFIVSANLMIKLDPAIGQHW